MEQAIGVILAAGKGTRMKSELPKVLCEAAGRPLITYVIDSLRAAGVGRLLAVVGYREELVRAKLASQVDLGFASQTEQLGTGHAVMMCREALSSHVGPVVIVAGDSPMLQASSVRALLEDFVANKPACLLGTLKHPNPQGLGRIVRDASGKFLRIVEEKDATEAERAITEVNMSTYVFDCQKMLAALGQLTANNKQKEYYITDLPEILMRQGEDVRALACLQPSEALSVNTLEQLADVETALAAHSR